MQENISDEKLLISKSTNNKIFLHFVQIFVLLVLLGIVYVVGNYFTFVQKNKSEFSLDSKTENYLADENNDVKINDCPNIDSEVLDLSVFNDAVENQDYQRYAVLEDKNLLLLSLIGGQEIKKEINNIKYGSGSLGYGSSDPSNSPDLLKVAYIDESNNLHLTNSKGDVDIKISDTLTVDYISAWSPDSQRLIFHVNAPTLKSQVYPDEYMGEEPTGKITLNKNYYSRGFYLLDLKNSTLSHLFALDDSAFYSWINNSKVLIKLGDYQQEKFIVYDIDSYVADLSIMDGGLEKDFGTQFVFSADGSKWALTWHGGTNQTTSASIVLADFPSVSGKEIMKSDFAQIQGPVISPNGQMVAFRGYEEQNGPLFTYLYDGEKVEKVLDGFPRVWINDTQFIYMITDPSHATNPSMADKLFIYDVQTKKSTQLYKFAEN